MDNRKIAIVTFFSILIIGFFTGLILPLRPEISDMEQRQLTKFPTVSAKTLFNGEFFSEVGLWYADSYPGREGMIKADNAIKNIYGIKSGAKMVGSATVADEIPDFENMETADNQTAMDNTAVGNGKQDIIDELIPDRNIETIPVEDVVEEEEIPEEEPEEIDEEALHADGKIDESEVEIPKATVMEEEIKQHVKQNLYVKDGAAYSAYYFTLDTANRYIALLNNAADILDGECTVYNMIVPNQSGVMLSEDEMKAFGGSDQAAAIHYYYSQYDKVKSVNTVDTLREHNDEYLYFRTDHHWTARGAYYVYRSFCKVKGIEPHELDYFEKMTFDDFLGSFYTDLKDPEMESNPDYIEAFVPRDTNDMTFWYENGESLAWNVVRDVNGWNKYAKYSCFIGGDMPLCLIENPVINDGSSCVVIKESYGNCFVPFLVDHYQTVYVIDYRYSDKNIISFIRENNINDLIVLNNVSVLGSGSVMTKLENMLK